MENNDGDTVGYGKGAMSIYLFSFSLLMELNNFQFNYPFILSRLQITTQLISKYPSSLPNCELSPLLVILYQLLPQHRHGERTPYVLRCLTEVALCQGKKSNLEVSQKSDLLKFWIKIWSLTFRGISSEQIQAENFGLLGAIIQGSLIEVDREFWKLFTGSACRPSW